MVFPDVIVCFPLIGFPSAGFTPLIKEFRWARKGKGTRNSTGREGKGKGEEKERERKRKGKGKDKESERKRKGKRKEKERKRKRKRRKKERKKDRKKERKGRGKWEEQARKGSVSHGPFLMPEVYLSFSLSFVNPVCVCSFFFWKWLQSSKKECSDHLPGIFLVQNPRHYDNKQWKEETKSTK